MVENLYTGLFAQAAGKDVSKFTEFLKQQVAKGNVFNLYHRNEGIPVDNNESAAAYALATRFLNTAGEQEAADFCYERTLWFQIGEDNLFYGGFGEEETGLVYAFDQLEALLMLRMVENE